ncbi:MAG: T9SS type A sorting domain-containing protein, partial [Bacteroidota bacterium]
SNAITRIVNPLLPVSVTIAASANSVCAGISVTLTATPTNGGVAPVYQWKNAGVVITGATNVTYSYIPTNGDVITCMLTSNATCPTGNPAVSNAVTMIVNPLLPVSVTIGASANNVCAGTSVVFTATPTNGGTSPAYQWKKGSSIITGATNATYSYAPVNNDVISCVLTSNTPCATGNPASSNSITMTVIPGLQVGAISGDQTICANATPAGLTSTPPTNGTQPVYQWQSSLNNITFSNINAATMLLYQPGTLNATTYYRQLQNSTGTCGGPLPTNTVTITVNPWVPVGVTIVPSANPYCAGSSVTFTATPVNGGSSPIYVWKVNGIVTGTNSPVFTYQPVNNNVVTCALTSNASCITGNPATSNAVTLTESANFPASISIVATANTVCAGTSVTFTATAVNGGTNPAYQWKVNGTNSGTNASTFSYNPSNNDVVTCVLTSNLLCASGNPATSNQIIMTVNPILPVSVSIAASANPVCAGTTVTYTATPVNGGGNPGYIWRKAGVSISGATNATYSYIPVNNDQITCMLTSNAVCTTGNPATSNVVTMTVNQILPVSVTIAASATTVCAGTQVTMTATPLNGGSSPAFLWKRNGATVSGATNSTYTFIPVTGDVMSCVLTSSAPCTTGNPAASNQVTITVNPLLPVSVTIAASSNPVFIGTSVTFTATVTNGGSAPVYQWKVNGINAGTSSSTYSYIPVNNDVVTCILTSNATCVTNNPATSNAITMVVVTVPVNLVLENLNITDTRCYNATQIITVAGGTTTFTVQSGARVTMIAGQKISYLPGVWVKNGGYLYGYITPNGQYCSSLPPSMVATVTGEEEIPFTDGNLHVKIYPNPTTDKFTLELFGIEKSEKIRVEIYGMTGAKVMSEDIAGEMKHDFSLSDKPVGIYLIQVISSQGSYTSRIIKR